MTAQNSSTHQSVDSSPLSYDLPFFEDWESHDFSTNNWTISGNEWEIDTTTGNNGASAKFNGSILLTNYLATLTSDWLNAVHTSQIYLKYDLMLTDLQQTETECLVTELFDGTGWIAIDSVFNNGSFSWQSYHRNITTLVKCTDFKIRFTAKGVQSNNIQSWHIDNVEVYSVCDNPTDLSVEDFWNAPNDWGTQVSWNAPELPMGPAPYLGYDNGTFFTGIGLSNGTDFTVAIRWDAGQLSDVDSTLINKVTFYTPDISPDYFILKIWTDSNASNLIYQDTLTGLVADTWNVVPVTDTLFIDGSLEYWLGYEVVGQKPNTFPAGADSGPAVAGYGDMVKVSDGDWTTLSGSGLNYNFNLGMQVVTAYSSVSCFDTIIGFNIYRSNDYDSNYVFLATEPFEEGTSYYEYKDYLMDSMLVCYKVNAIWKNGGDTCYSDYATTLTNPMERHVCIVIDGMDNLYLVPNKALLFPNPTNRFLTLQTGSPMQEISVFNVMGKPVLNKFSVASAKYTLDVSLLSNGLYFVKINTENRIVTGKFIINR